MSTSEPAPPLGAVEKGATAIPPVGDVVTDHYVLGSDAARAVGRFKPGGPDGYRAKSLPNGRLFATRAEAEAAERACRG